MIAKKCIFWLTTDHGCWVTLVHGEYTFGNWWLLRLVCSTIWFACSCYLTVRVISFLCYFSQGYLPLHIPKLEERGRKARRFVLNQVQVNQRNLWDGSRWLKQWCYQERKFCFLWKTWGILYNWAVNCIELCMALLYLKLHGPVFVVLTTIMSFRYLISLARFLLFSQITVYTIIYWVISFVLQTDTSLAIEAKLMKRWEFDSIAQAAGCMSSWFSGTPSEKLLLKEHLDSASGVNSNSHHCFQT